ncbi:MAG: response regulator [Pseudomonadota bacterium]|nr:response regulator [Pseudomonadota bacterium]
MEKRRILFVDDEPYLLHGLQRTLRGQRDVWDMAFVSDPRQALALVEREPIDVVVSDLRMPGLSGTRLLAEVRRLRPQAVRIMLSGIADQNPGLDALAVTHQFLAKPCDAGALKAAVARALALRKFLDGDTPLKALVSRLDTLPSLPDQLGRIIQELDSPDAHAPTVAAIVAADPAMSAKILHLINSAFFGLPRQVADLNKAVLLLGLDTIRALVLTAQVFSRFEPLILRTFPVDRLWRHCTAVGSLAQRIARAEGGDRALLDHALTAGLLHDVGKLILMANLPGRYAEVLETVRREALPATVVERQLLGAAHGETGAYLLGLWGLPEAIVEAVAYHHHPRDCESAGFSAVTAVHAANALIHELTDGAPAPPPDGLDQACLAALGLEGRVPRWRRLGRMVLGQPAD